MSESVRAWDHCSFSTATSTTKPYHSTKILFEYTGQFIDILVTVLLGSIQGLEEAIEIDQNELSLTAKLTTELAIAIKPHTNCNI